MLHRRTVLGALAATGAGFIGRAGPARGESRYLSGGCNADNTPFPARQFETGPPRPELQAIFRRVLEAAGIASMNVELLETADPAIKAYAQYLDTQRTVVVNSQLVTRQLESRWNNCESLICPSGRAELVALLGHEIAHFTLNHVFGDPLRDKWSEAAADRFAGFVTSRVPSIKFYKALRVFDGMAHGGRYAPPNRRKNFFLLGADEPAIFGTDTPKSYLVKELDRIAREPYGAPLSPDGAPVYSRSTYDALHGIGVVGEVFLARVRTCRRFFPAGQGLALDYGVGFSQSGRIRYRVLSLLSRRWVSSEKSEVISVELKAEEYGNPDELFFMEAGGYDLSDVDITTIAQDPGGSGLFRRCAANGLPPPRTSVD